MFYSRHERPALPPPRSGLQSGAFALSPRRLDAGPAVGFLGHLAESWSVAAAARHVGKSRESACRLRDRPGAESFAAAWDFILTQPRAARMSTHELLWHRPYYGSLKPIMRGGKHVATRHSSDNDAVLRLYRREMQRRRALRDLDGKSR